MKPLRNHRHKKQIMKSHRNFGIQAEKRSTRKTQKPNLKDNSEGNNFSNKREEQTQEMKENPKQIIHM